MCLKIPIIFFFVAWDLCKSASFCSLVFIPLRQISKMRVGDEATFYLGNILHQEMS